MAETSAVDTLVAGNTAFALNLYGKLRAQKGNLFFSPYSISTALAMTYAGARGDTATQMARTLHFDLPQDKLHPSFAVLESQLRRAQENGKIRLDTANSLWPKKQYSLLPEFLEVCRKNYGVSITPVDYPNPGRKIINEWVAEKTRRRILELIKPGMMDTETRLVLVNAVYFYGAWLKPFRATPPMEQPFHISTNEQVRCQLMVQHGNYAYAETPELQILELAYAGNDLSMVILLPRKLDGIGALEEQLTPAKLAEWTKALPPAPSQKYEDEVAVLLPRFKATCEFRLVETLKGMGMKDACSWPAADFSGIDRSRDLFISEAIHQAFVGVHEEGTEAAAATAVVMRVGAAPRQIPIFRADHPFVFLIRDRHTGSILFIGRLMSPTT